MGTIIIYPVEAERECPCLISLINELKKESNHNNTVIVDEYLRTSNPSSMRTEVPFNLRGYISYVDANHITDPNEVPYEIIKSFFHHEE